jgi:hypothetical protein
MTMPGAGEEPALFVSLNFKIFFRPTSNQLQDLFFIFCKVGFIPAVFRVVDLQGTSYWQLAVSDWFSRQGRHLACLNRRRRLFYPYLIVKVLTLGENLPPVPLC